MCCAYLYWCIFLLLFCVSFCLLLSPLSAGGLRSFLSRSSPRNRSSSSSSSSSNSGHSSKISSSEFGGVNSLNPAASSAAAAEGRLSAAAVPFSFELSPLSPSSCSECLWGGFGRRESAAAATGTSLHAAADDGLVLDANDYTEKAWEAMSALGSIADKHESAYVEAEMLLLGKQEDLSCCCCCCCCLRCCW